jgi:hypothetical protein
LLAGLLNVWKYSRVAHDVSLVDGTLRRERSKHEGRAGNRLAGNRLAGNRLKAVLTLYATRTHAFGLGRGVMTAHPLSCVDRMTWE